MLRKPMLEFQSPQWGNNSKAAKAFGKTAELSFSPRNGEIILKFPCGPKGQQKSVSVPAMGK